LPEAYQNLVYSNLCFNEKEIPVHKDKHDGFETIYVYVCEDDGKGNYYGSLATDWQRWEYSLNMVRGKKNWFIIESLPNDFMDNPTKYLPQQPVQGK